MIDPEVEIVDLEPEGFARLNRLLAARLYRPRSELHVLHESGRVLRAVHTVDGPVELDDPVADPGELLDSAGVDRVILVDRSRSPELAAALLDAASRPTQPELLWASRRAFWSSPAVVTAPEPPDDPWPAVAERACSLGDDWWAVGGAWAGDELEVSLVARLTQGRVVFLTSADHFGVRPPRGRAHELVEAVEESGPVPVAWLCDIADLEHVIAADEPFAALRQAEDGALLARGLDQLTR